MLEYFSQLDEAYIIKAIEKIIEGDKAFKGVTEKDVRRRYADIINGLSDKQAEEYRVHVLRLSKTHDEEFTRYAVDACQIYQAWSSGKSCKIKKGELYIDGKNTYKSNDDNKVTGFEEDDVSLPNIDDLY